MNKEKIEELMEYNLEYLEARNSENIFGGDYTSQVDLKYANKKLERLQQENKQLKDNWDKLKDEIDKQIIKQQDIDKFAEEHGFSTYNPVRLIIKHFKNKMQELEKGDSNE